MQPIKKLHFLVKIMNTAFSKIFFNLNICLLSVLSALNHLSIYPFEQVTILSQGVHRKATTHAHIHIYGQLRVTS